MANEALTEARWHRTFLTSAEGHVGDTIAELRECITLEKLNIAFLREIRRDYVQMDGDREVHTNPARVAQIDAAIARNEDLIGRQNTAAHLLAVVAGGLNKFAAFATRISRAISQLFA